MYRQVLAFSAAAMLLAGSAMAATAQSSTGPVTVQLAPENNSGESGTAVLTDNGDGTTTVKINVTGFQPGVSQPTHIHTGHCQQSDFDPKPKYPLTNTMDGTSDTTVKVSLADLLASPFAVNLHKSNTEAGTYTACGNIVLAAQTGVVPGAPKTGEGGGAGSGEAPLAGWAAAGALALVAGGLGARRFFSR